jgi:ketosteroid isomerase-like protein
VDVRTPPAADKPEAPHRYLLNGDIFLVELIDRLVDAAGISVSDLEDPAEALARATYPVLIDLVARLTRLWTEPLVSESEAIVAFRETYADPVRINGTDVPLPQLVARARMLQRAFSDLEIEPIDQVESGDRFVLAFLQRGRHTGPFETPLGSVEASGRAFEIRVIDVLTIGNGHITAIEVVPDNLSLMMQLGAVRLAD